MNNLDLQVATDKAIQRRVKHAPDIYQHLPQLLLIQRAAYSLIQTSLLCFLRLLPEACSMRAHLLEVLRIAPLLAQNRCIHAVLLVPLCSVSHKPVLLDLRGKLMTQSSEVRCDSYHTRTTSYYSYQPTRPLLGYSTNLIESYCFMDPPV
jgi:hypothetical protein